jgi:apolipoprotein N-acyltransferase
VNTKPPGPAHSRLMLVFAFALGAATVLGFAPFYWSYLPILTIAVLLRLWQRAASSAGAAALGFAFGLGFFLAGVSWVYVSLHDFGAMPAPLAALATLLFCAHLAAFAAAAGYCTHAARVGAGLKFAVLFPAVWTLAEWVRGWLFTGFPWLALGYSQIPGGPLAGYAPVLGIYGVTLAATATSGLLVAAASQISTRDEGGWMREEGTPRRIASFLLHPSSLILAVLWLGGWALHQVVWTAPEGTPVSVSLLQGNVPQDMKWRPERVGETLKSYRELAQSSTSRLIILPETALPLFLDDVPRGYLHALVAHARGNDGDILAGVPERMPNGEYFNSVLSFGTAPTQNYRKSHLVPFGEFIPLRPVLGAIVRVLSIPLQDFSRGAADQRPMRVAGLRIAVNVCYEDAFGEEIIRQLPAANVLVNVSNVAWFGRSIAPQQHLQISQARALETGRYMLRATNTGATAVIDQRGRVVKSAPEFTRAVVTHDVPGHTGQTPYVRWGNYAVLVLCVVLLVAALVTGRLRPD